MKYICLCKYIYLLFKGIEISEKWISKIFDRILIKETYGDELWILIKWLLNGDRLNMFMENYI